MSLPQGGRGKKFPYTSWGFASRGLSLQKIWTSCTPKNFRTPLALPETKLVRKEPPSGSLGDTHPDEAVYRPFDNFPPELLSYILTLAWNSHNKEDSHSRFIFPSSFNRVNRYFNLIILSTPTLWSHLQITSISSLAHIQDRIHNRCGVLPLDIHIIFHRTKYPDARRMLEATMALASFRCQSLVLCYNEPPITEIPEGENHWDHLRVFTSSNPLRAVRLSIEGVSHTPLDLLPPFDSSVRFISLFHCRFTWSPTTLPINLQEFVVHEQVESRVSTAKIALCLHGSPRYSLRSLSLSGFFVREEPGKPESPCSLELLENLELGTFYFSEAALLLALLFAPNLHRLSLHVVPGSRVPDTLVVTWSNLRFPNLRKLKLQDFQSYRGQLIELVQNLPRSVRYLEVIENEPIKALSDQSTTVFCGQLHHIVVHDVPLRIFSRFVEGRCTSLQTLTARYAAVANVYRFLDQSQLWAYLDVLETSVPQLMIVLDGGDSEADELKYLTVEDLKGDFLQASSVSLSPE